MFITKTGVMLDELDEESIVKVDIEGNSETETIASIETPVHRAIYKNTPSLAVIHSHPPHAIVLSLTSEGEIVLNGMESYCFLPKIPIVTGEAGSEELAKNVAQGLQDNKGVIAKGHGTFAVGESLEKAYVNICLIEHACQVKYLLDLMK